MCFSATASLAAGVGLTAVGVATVARTKKKKNLAIASIPLLFGVQQLIDGVVWLTFGYPIVSAFAIYAYALFAFVLWPVYVPISLIPIEPIKYRREILEALVVVGVGVGLFFMYYLIMGSPSAQIINRCVAYDVPHPYGYLSLAFYLLVTAGAFLISSRPILRFFGIVLSISFGIAGWFYVETFSSVWCFFSALLSLIIFWYIRKEPVR